MYSKLKKHALIIISLQYFHFYIHPVGIHLYKLYLSWKILIQEMARMPYLAVNTCTNLYTPQANEKIMYTKSTTKKKPQHQSHSVMN